MVNFKIPADQGGYDFAKLKAILKAKGIITNDKDIEPDKD